MSAQPKVRAGWTKSLLGGVWGLDHRTAQAVRAAIDAPCVARIEAAINLSWVTLDDHLALLRGLRGHLTRDAYVDYFEAVMTDTLANPSLFAKAAGAAMRWAAGEPFAILHFMPVSARYVLHEVGEVRVESGSHPAERLVVHEGWPPAVGQDDAFALGWLASLRAMLTFALGAGAGRAEVRLEDDDPRRFRFRCTVPATPRQLTA